MQLHNAALPWPPSTQNLSSEFRKAARPQMLLLAVQAGTIVASSFAFLLSEMTLVLSFAEGLKYPVSNVLSIFLV